MTGAATNGKHKLERPSELLRFATAGSVDDGKSTLIGRLLYDTKQIFADQLEHIEQTSERRGDRWESRPVPVRRPGVVRSTAGTDRAPNSSRAAAIGCGRWGRSRC